jgi:hypothetical protein
MPDGPLVQIVPSIVRRLFWARRVRRRAERRWLIGRIRRAFDLGLTSFEEVHADSCPAECTCPMRVRFSKDAVAITHRKACRVRTACTCVPTLRVNHILDDGSFV